jgi:hypothetical protein
VLACLLVNTLLISMTAVTHGPPLIVEGFTGAPVEIPGDKLTPGVISERWWKRDANGVTERIAEYRMRKSLTPAAWLEQWRSGHGCAAAVTRRIEPIARLKAPQLTFTGACKGGEAYVIHLVQLKNVMVEIQVDAEIQVDTKLDVELEEAMRALLARVRLPDESRKCQAGEGAPPSCQGADFTRVNRAGSLMAWIIVRIRCS